MTGRLLRKARWAREPGGAPLFLRDAGSVLRAPFTWLSHWLRLRRLGRRGVDQPRRWHGRTWMRFVTWSIWLLALIFLLWLARSAFVVIRGRPVHFLIDPDDRCSKGDIGVSCSALSGFVTSLLSIALASAVFLLWRLQRVRHRYRAKARQRPGELVPTAGTFLGEIVGRDELCQVVMEDLRDRDTRRPRVLIGGVGTGKTAVIVKLTELLARRGAVPVPIRLREADELDFGDLAKKQFVDEINEHLASESEGERVWRRLLRDDQIVVLADGLEEAFFRAKDDQERDNRIRIAIRTARQQHLPLFIASRPHDPLRGVGPVRRLSRQIRRNRL
jgi:hypothetical protein